MTAAKNTPELPAEDDLKPAKPASAKTDGVGLSDAVSELNKELAAMAPGMEPDGIETMPDDGSLPEGYGGAGESNHEKSK